MPSTGHRGIATGVGPRPRIATSTRKRDDHARHGLFISLALSPPQDTDMTRLPRAWEEMRRPAIPTREQGMRRKFVFYSTPYTRARHTMVAPHRTKRSSKHRGGNQAATERMAQRSFGPEGGRGHDNGAYYRQSALL